MISILLDAALSLELFIFAILAHETGHIIAFRFYDIKTKLQLKKMANGFKFMFKTPETYQRLSDFQKCIIYLFGIGFGWIFLGFSLLFFNINDYFIALWAVVYTYGCKNDINNLYSCWKSLRLQSMAGSLRREKRGPG